MLYERFLASLHQMSMHCLDSLFGFFDKLNEPVSGLSDVGSEYTLLNRMSVLGKFLLALNFSKSQILHSLVPIRGVSLLAPVVR